MFGAYKFRDVVAMQDCGALGAFNLGSVSSTLYTGTSASVSTFQTIGGSNNFHRLVYRLYIPLWGQSTASNFAFGSLSLGLASLSSTYWSVVGLASASSSSIRNSAAWAKIDSANCVVTLNSATQSASPNTLVAVLDVRPEKFSAQWPYVTPYIAFNAAASGAVSATAALTCDAYLTDFEPASNFDQKTQNWHIRNKLRNDSRGRDRLYLKPRRGTEAQVFQEVIHGWSLECGDGVTNMADFQ